ncbi:MAG: hypothetical protein AAF800_03080 [Planctomycetota bacterium]
MAVARFAVYAYAGRPALNWWGRWHSGRWRIAGYDSIYLGPAAVIAVGLLFWLLLRVGLDPMWMFSAGTAAVTAAALNTAPSLARWRTTGRCRLPLRRAKPAKSRSETHQININLWGGRRGS